MNGAIPWSRQVLHDALDDGGDVGDAATSDADGHAGAGLKARREAALLEPCARLGTDVGKAEVGEILADEQQSGGKHQAISIMGGSDR